MSADRDTINRVAANLRSNGLDPISALKAANDLVTAWPALFDAEVIYQVTQLRGMIWWLASQMALPSLDLAIDHDPGTTAEAWVELAEKHWQAGLKSETRFVTPHPYEVES